MAFPQNNINVTFIDFPLNALKSARRLYLPIQKRQVYLEQFGSSCNLYIRTSDFPQYLKSLMKDILKNVLKNNFFFLEDSLINSWILDEPNFKLLKRKKRIIQKWMKLIQNTENWEKGVRGKRIFICAVFLSYAIPETEFKKQFHILSAVPVPAEKRSVEES